MNKCINCERWLNYNRASKEIMCHDFTRSDRNIKNLDKEDNRSFRFEKVYEEEQ